MPYSALSYAMKQLCCNSATWDFQATLKQSAEQARHIFPGHSMEFAALLFGLKYINGGNFSLVFQHPDCPEYVGKLSIRGEDAYNSFAAYCRNNKHPNLPKIHKSVRSCGMVYHILDVLVPIGAHQDDIGKFIDYHGVELARSYGADVDTYWSKAPNWKHSSDPTGPVLAMCDILRYFEQSVSYDLHGANIMLDPRSGEIIITDPVSY